MGKRRKRQKKENHNTSVVHGVASEPEMMSYERGFDASNKNIIGNEWLRTGESFNEDVRQHYNKITRISRYMCTNNDYCKGLSKLLVHNIVGPSGYRINAEFKSQRGNLMDQENAEIEQHFNDFSRHGICEVSGRFSLSELSKNLLISCMRDGGSLLRFVYDEDVNEYGFGLQYIPVTALDVDLNHNLQSGERIRMGIGLGKYNKVVAYYLKADHGRNAVYIENKPYFRVEADKMIHLYRSDYGEAYRDVSWFASSLIRMNLIEGMDEATLQATRSGAANSAFLIQRETKGLDSGQFSPEQLKRKNIRVNLKPLEVPMLPPNIEKVENFNPDQPKGTYEPFLKTQLRGVASSQGVSYNTYANNLEAISYSSIRQRKLDDEDTYLCLQNWFKENVNQEIHRRFMAHGHMMHLYKSRYIKKNFKKFLYPSFEGRRWKAIDPLKEIRADIEAMEAGVKSRKRVMNERGINHELEQKQIEKEWEFNQKIQLNKPGNKKDIEEDI